MGLIELIIGAVAVLVLVAFVWFVDSYKKNEYDDLDFYDGEES
jgi:nitrogen fixation-related uncharacterized protein